MTVARGSCFAAEREASARVRVSCLEIHNENIYDLLSKDGAATAKSVVIRDNEAGEQVVTGLT